jgi:hypothetical protein
MADDPLTDLKTLFPGIQKEAILETCIQLSAFTPAGLGDDYLRAMLGNVWFSVNQLIEQDQSLNQPPASLREFNNNVKDRGEESFFNLLKDRAEDVRTSGFVTRWAPLFRDGTSFSLSLKYSGHCLCLDVFYKAHEDQVLYADVNESSVNGM